jgi:hypothetical protein
VHPFPERRCVLRVHSVWLEQAVWQAVDRSERPCEPRLVEAGIMIRGQIGQFVFRVPAIGQDDVPVDVVPYLCPSEQGTDLVSHGIACVQYTPSSTFALSQPT